jgi:hypothetical protein
MPSERRQIILSKNEVLQAIQAYRRTRTNFLPHGEVAGFTLKPAAGDSGVRLTVDVGMVYGQTRQTIAIEATEADVVDMMIRCCLENNIPIPKAGRKSAGVVDGMLALIIYSDDTSPGAATPAHGPP